jgi:hypothetical protein
MAEILGSVIYFGIFGSTCGIRKNPLILGTVVIPQYTQVVLDIAYKPK